MNASYGQFRCVNYCKNMNEIITHSEIRPQSCSFSTASKQTQKVVANTRHCCQWEQYHNISCFLLQFCLAATQKPSLTFIINVIKTYYSGAPEGETEHTEPPPNCCLRAPTPCVPRQLLLDCVLVCQASSCAAAPIDAAVKEFH